VKHKLSNRNELSARYTAESSDTLGLLTNGTKASKLNTAIGWNSQLMVVTVNL
jgi:hypothetical protein